MSEPTSNTTRDDLLKKYQTQAKEHAIICIDPAGIVTAWLGAAEQVFGYTPQEAVGRSFALIFTPEDQQKGFHQYELTVAMQQSRSEDDRWHVRKDGIRIWVTGSVDPITDEEGVLLGYVKVVRDKTDLRAHIDTLENQLAATQRANEKTRVFLSTLGHELRNPLSPIQTAASIIQKLSTDSKTDKAAQIIASQVAVLSQLAQDLMDVSRVGAGKVQLNLKKTDLRTVLSEAEFAQRRTASDKGIKLQALLPDGPLEVALDEQRFARVVLNLLSNAIKYTNSGGTVWIKATQEGSEVILRVEDTGIGIAPKVLPRIFELFTQEREAADLVPDGLGIGLTIVKELVELHGGSVQARSAGRGKGAEFTVRLPAVDTGAQDE